MGSIQKLLDDYSVIKERISNYTDLKIKSTVAHGITEDSGVYICCYVTHKDVSVIYIGSSSNIRKRITNSAHPIHKYHGKGYNLFYIECDEYLELEKELIIEFKPKYNVEYTRG